MAKLVRVIDMERCMGCRACIAACLTENYYTPVSHVYRSEDPFDFGVDDGGEHYVTSLACACPKTYVVDGVEYVSSNHNTTRGVEMCRLRWVPV